MQFQSIGAQGNYARAGKAAADDTLRSFLAQRDKSPDYGKLAMDAAEIKSVEKRAAVKAESEVAQAGISASANVQANQKKIDGEMAYKKGKRMAGVLAAGGQMVGQAGEYYMSSKDRKLRETGTMDPYYDKQRDRVQGKLEENQAEIERLENWVYEEPSLGETPGASSTTDGELVATATPTPKLDGGITGEGGGTVSQPNGGNTGDINTFSGMYGLAKNSGAKFPELVAAQWALESGWGKTPSGKNNYFGVKATSGQAGTSKGTWEVENGKEINTTARFRDYASPQESVDDLVSKWHKNYGSYTGVNNAKNAFGAADMLRSEGYATDPAYAAKLKKIMREQGYGG